MLLGASILVLGLLVGVAYHAPSVYATSTNADAIAARKAQLEAELAKLEELIEEQQTLLESTTGERVTLERDLKRLGAEIQKARLNIKASEVAIAQLEDDIYDTKATIARLDEKMDRERESLVSLLQRTAEIDDHTIVEVLLSNKSFGEFFEEFNDFKAVQEALHASFRELQGTRATYGATQQTLEDQRDSELDAKMVRQLQAKKLNEQEQEKTRILKTTKGQETAYQKLIKENKRTAAQIRAELFELRGSSAISLGDAIEFANFASSKTGVRTAFILGILKQETELGSYLGGCTYDEERFGKPVMKPTRDQAVFRAISETLGFNASTQPVSCSQTADTWGGAMGPSQFIPSTWACYGGYVNAVTHSCSNTSDMTRDQFYSGTWGYDASQDRLRILRGKQSPSNPWDNQDAFLATALYMKEMGADAGGYDAEHTAAMRYFAGYGGAANPSPYVRSYGDSVMEHTAYYQKQMDILTNLDE